MLLEILAKVKVFLFSLKKLSLVNSEFSRKSTPRERNVVPSEKFVHAKTSVVVIPSMFQSVVLLVEPMVTHVLQTVQKIWSSNKETAMKNVVLMEISFVEPDVVMLHTRRLPIVKSVVVTTTLVSPRNLPTSPANSVVQFSNSNQDINVSGKRLEKEREDIAADSKENGLARNTLMEKENANSLDTKSPPRNLLDADGNNSVNSEDVSTVAIKSRLVLERDAKLTLVHAHSKDQSTSRDSRKIAHGNSRALHADKSDVAQKFTDVSSNLVRTRDVQFVLENADGLEKDSVARRELFVNGERLVSLDVARDVAHSEF